MRCTSSGAMPGGREQRLGDQPVVALLVLGRHAALVGEPELRRRRARRARRRAARRFAGASCRRSARGARSPLLAGAPGEESGRRPPPRARRPPRRRHRSSVGHRPSASVLGQHRLRRAQRRDVGRVAQQRLADALAEDAPLAARGPGDPPRALARPSRSRACASSPPGPRSRLQLQARKRSRASRPRGRAPGAPAPPRGATRRPGGSAWALPSSASPRATSGLGFQPQPRGQPARQQHRADRRVRVVADRDALDRAQFRAPRRRIEARRDTLAPRASSAATRDRRRRPGRSACTRGRPHRARPARRSSRRSTACERASSDLDDARGVRAATTAASAGRVTTSGSAIVRRSSR